MIQMLGEKPEPQFLDICEAHLLGTRLHTLYRAYGAESPFLSLWMAETDGQAAAAIGRFDGWVTVVALPHADLEEISALLRQIGDFWYLESSPEVCLGIQRYLGGGYRESVSMLYEGDPPNQDTAWICSGPKLDDVFRILREDLDFSLGVEYSSWLTHTSHLVRHGLGFCCTLELDGTPVATGGVYTMGRAHGVIGSVMTLPEHRGKGYASAVIRYLTDCVLDLGKKPAVLCGDPALTTFYSPLGFMASGSWAQLAFE